VNQSGVPDTKYADKVVLNAENLEMHRTDSFKLTADVQPVSVLDETVTYSSDNDKVATVSESGLVTAVGDGTANITVTANAKSKDGKVVSAVCKVTVKPIDIDLSGILQGESSSWTSFNTQKIDELVNNHTIGADELLYLSAAYTDKKIFAATLESDTTSALYNVDGESYKGEKVGNCEVLCSDMTYGKGTGYAYAVYGPYVIILDTATGELAGAYNISKYVGEDYFLGVAELAPSQYEGTPCDYLYAITQSGALYQLLLVPGMGYGIDKLGDTGIKCPGYVALSSLTYDAESDFLICSSFNSDNESSDIYAVKDIYDSATKTDTIKSFKLGSTGANGIMTGLYQNGAKAKAPASAERISFVKADYVSEITAVEGKTGR
jgi:hypothetical protein